MLTIYRYRVPRLPEGQNHFELSLHGESAILNITEQEEGRPPDREWWTVINCLVDTRQPVETRRFVIATMGENLSGYQNSALAHVDSLRSRSGASWHLFEVL